MTATETERQTVGLGKTVLVVDDSVEMSDAVGLSLGSMGFTVLSANDPFAGVRMAVEHAPDAIVMDLDMPGMDGLEVMRHLKRIEQTRDIPVIAFTGQPVGFPDRLRRRGFDRIVTKADGLENLENEIEDVLQSCAA
jgi:two-component system cell cycle response regulator DivK